MRITHETRLGEATDDAWARRSHRVEDVAVLRELVRRPATTVGDVATPAMLSTVLAHLAWTHVR